MRNLRPPHRGRGKDGEASKNPPRTESARGKQLEWVEEDPNSSAQGGLQFVAETGVARPNGSFRDLIRSKARRKGKKQAENTKTARKSSGNCFLGIVDPDSERSRTTTPISSGHVTPKTSPKSPQTLHSVEDSLIDPFLTLPISDAGGTQFLINHYFAIFKPSYAPLFRKEDLLSFAITDPASLHSLLVHSALNLRGIGQLKHDPDMLYHQGETIRLINDRLGDVGQQFASDATISTVVNMTHLEILSGDSSGTKIHMDGLEALVKSRGGIQGLESHPLTRKLAMWTDTVASVALDAPPRFKLEDLTIPSQMPSPPTRSPLAQRYKTKISNLTNLPHLAEETISTYKDLRAITALKDTICFSPSSSRESQDFEASAHAIELLERRCLSILHSSFLYPHSPSSIYAIYPLFGNASLIHIMIFMRESPRRLPFACILSNRIRNCLENIDMKMFQIQYPEFLIWVLIMGGLGGVGTENQSWFAGLLARAAREAGMMGLKDVVLVCKDWLWTKLYVDEVGEGFWVDFEAAQGAEDVSEVEDAEAMKMEVDEEPFGYRFST
ncbi:hypothetical protein N431DRAFT_392008 [Stipitochalara longipes BDJ]|nr:hypothetical protein N431DRAFT_392008 [Stipitochalara longipes BDJ]